MKKILYIDGCIRRKTSRTERLAQAFLAQCRATEPCEIIPLVLENCDLPPLSAERLAQRERAIQTRDFTDKAFALAHQFLEADEIVIAAPYWDMSFPAAIKLYFEQVCINKLTFHYTEAGKLEGLTRIRKATYILTAGGPVADANNHGYNYVKSLLTTLFGVPEVNLIIAQGLDIFGNDPEAILRETLAQMHASTL